MKPSSERELHVGIDAHLLSLAENYRSAGINWYSQNLLRHLPGVDPGICYSVFVGEKHYGGVAGLNIKVSHLPTRSPLVRIFWEQAIQPWALWRTGVDLLHSLALVGPVAGTCPLVVTIHDLSFLRYPQNFPPLKRLYLELFTRLSVQKARRVVAISENTKRDILAYYHLPPDKVERIHYGRDPRFRPLPGEEVARFRAEHGLPECFILFVGTLEPRKNVVRLVDAFAKLPAPRPLLVLIGGKGWLYDEVFARIEELNLNDEVRWVGYTPVESLVWWYNAAELFVYPSVYEGFGLPPLEAMACGTPVVTSEVSSLPEVVGEAGLMVDPFDAGALADAMDRVLVDAELRASMRAAGLVQADTFSWPETARRTVNAYRQALMDGGDTHGV